MRIYGIDFTRRPTRRKPIAVARCDFDGRVLRLDRMDPFHDFKQFERLLVGTGPWVAGIDYPFGQPRKLIENLRWPSDSWMGYVAHLSTTEMSGFVRLLAEYRAARQKGDRQHLRQTDERARSRSPMVVFGVPVGRVFLRGHLGYSEAG